MGRTNNAHIHKGFPRIADTAHGFFLNGAQEFDLHGKRQIGNFVKEQSAAVSVLEKAETVLVRTGKAAFFVAEKFAFHQVFRNGTTVDGNKRFVAAVGQLVNRARRLLFTRTGLAGDINRNKAVGQSANQVAHFDHLRRSTQQARHIVLAFQYRCVLLQSRIDVAGRKTLF